MHILLDTHVLLWALLTPERLDGRTWAVLEDGANAILFSAASILEISIKAQLRRDDFKASADEVLDEARITGFVELPVHAVAAKGVGQLPLHHRDPFDRLLVAQALAFPAQLLTADKVLARYSELVLLIE